MTVILFAVAMIVFMVSLKVALPSIVSVALWKMVTTF
jgi:hypothetical protein